ncbi:MAG: hypothetical protein HYY17_12915 [Planctomycetes bacterium]|nr:hypothetical protein [Planctomycetota bacterium]
MSRARGALAAFALSAGCASPVILVEPASPEPRAVPFWTSVLVLDPVVRCERVENGRALDTARLKGGEASAALLAAACAMVSAKGAGTVTTGQIGQDDFPLIACDVVRAGQVICVEDALNEYAVLVHKSKVEMTAILVNARPYALLWRDKGIVRGGKAGLNPALISQGFSGGVSAPEGMGAGTSQDVTGAVTGETVGRQVIGADGWRLARSAHADRRSLCPVGGANPEVRPITLRLWLVRLR